MTVELVELEKLGLIGPVHYGGIRVVEAVLVEISQGVEICCRYKCIIDGMKCLSWCINCVWRIQRRPMTRLPANCNGPHIIRIDRVGSSLNSLTQATGD